MEGDSPGGIAPADADTVGPTMAAGTPTTALAPVLSLILPFSFCADIVLVLVIDCRANEPREGQKPFLNRHRRASICMLGIVAIWTARCGDRALTAIALNMMQTKGLISPSPPEEREKPRAFAPVCQDKVKKTPLRRPVPLWRRGLGRGGRQFSRSLINSMAWS